MDALERLGRAELCGDARQVAHDLAQGPVGDALAVREASTAKDVPVIGSERLAELPNEPALADAGQAQDREQDRLPFGPRPASGLAQKLKLLVAPGERGRVAHDATDRDARLHADFDRAPDGHRRGLALDVVGAGGLVGHRIRGRLVDDRADHHLARTGLLLQPRGQVQDVAGGHRGAAEWVAGHHLARFNPDPSLEGDAVALGRVRGELRQRVQDGERGPHRPLGVVLVGLLKAEHGHDRVAPELFGTPPEAADLGDGPLEELGHHRADDLRVVLVGQGRGRDEIGEQRGHVAPLLGSHPRHEGMATVRAEPRIVRIGPAAVGAGRHAARVYGRPAAIRYLWILEWNQRLVENSPGATRTDVPYLVISATDDLQVSYDTQVAGVNAMCAVGDTIELRTVTGGHDAMFSSPAVWSAALDWIEARFAGAAATSTCGPN